MNGIQLNFFWLPKEVVYYVIIPMVAILFIYLIFTILYRRKKGTRYYNYVVDYVYSTLGIVFCGLLFCLILGYSIATLQILIVNRIISNYVLLAVVLAILPFIPAAFLIYVVRVYIRNLKRKNQIDKEDVKEELKDEVKEVEKTKEEVKEEAIEEPKQEVEIDHENDEELVIPKEQLEPLPSITYEDVELVKKKNG